MPITVELPDTLFTAEEQEKLRKLFDTKTDAAFSKALSKITRAALEEYKEMFLEKGLPTKADEIQQHRLCHMINCYFNGRLPTEAEISDMFQITQAQSRSLLRSVITRFHFELEDELRNSLKEIIQKAKYDEDMDKYLVVIQSDNILERLNHIIASEAPKLNLISRVRNMSRTYAIPLDSCDILCDYLGLPRKNPEAKK